MCSGTSEMTHVRKWGQILDKDSKENQASATDAPRPAARRDTPQIFRPEGGIPAEGPAVMSGLVQFEGVPLSDFDMPTHLND